MDPQVPEHESLIIERGIAAEQLLESEVFQAAVLTLKSRYIQEFTESGPLETQRREAVYARVNAVKDVEYLLNEWVGERDQVVARQNDADAADQSDY